MTVSKLGKMLSILTRRFDERRIPFAAVGAMALGAYGLPRFTADIDLLSEERYRAELRNVLEDMDFTCFQENDAFAQFDSEMGVYGKVDLMFVSTPAGTAILERSIRTADELLGRYPVIQPSDYIILKLMAAANDPSRKARDEGDIAALLNHIRHKNLPDSFEPVQQDRILDFARRFGLEKKMEQLFQDHGGAGARKNFFML